MSAIESAAASLLESSGYTSESTFDALGRPVTVLGHDGSLTVPGYNEAGALETLDVHVRGATTATHFVTSVSYDAQGRRESITYGNGVITTYTYDPLSHRLARMKSTRPKSGGGTETVQNLSYTYDANGSIVAIDDTADQPLLFANTVVGAGAEYTYDALGRLVRSEGREHPGTVGEVAYGPFGDGRTGHAHPSDGTALRPYSETYEYDLVGNLKRVLHQAGLGASWSRRYAYASESNRLAATSLPGDLESGPYSAVYTHDAAGNMTSMPHLASMLWTADEKLAEVDLGGGGTAFYQYDASGERVRKVVERIGSVREERVYPGGVEVFRKWIGTTLDRERETLRVLDGEQAVAEVDTLTVDSGSAVTSVVSRVRYQLSNHLGSAHLELDSSAAVIAYEEFFPYGASSYEARVSSEVPERRYRYTGMERDEESGLQRHGVRYYAPWLGRWASADPAGMVDGVNRFAYVRGDPVGGMDPSGAQTAVRPAVPQPRSAPTAQNDPNSGSDVTSAGHNPCLIGLQAEA